MEKLFEDTNDKPRGYEMKGDTKKEEEEEEEEANDGTQCVNVIKNAAQDNNAYNNETISAGHTSRRFQANSDDSSKMEEMECRPAENQNETELQNYYDASEEDGYDLKQQNYPKDADRSGIGQEPRPVLSRTIARTKNSKRGALQVAELMAEWTDSLDLPKVDLQGILFLITVTMALIVCPVLSITKSNRFLSFPDLCAPLMIKRNLSMAIGVASILIGLAISAYIILLPCLRSVFIVLEAPSLSYSKLILSWMHTTVGGRLAYDCIGQAQVLKRRNRQTDRPTMHM